MTSLFNKHRWMQVMWGILLAVAGIITIVFTATSSNGASESVLVLSVSIAIILFAYGFAILFTTFLEMKDKLFKPELIIGAIILAFAIVFCLRFNMIKDLIVVFSAINLLSFGSIFIARAIIAFVKKNRPVWRVFCIIFAVLFIACGVLALIFESNCREICFFVIGGLLILAGISQIVLAIREAIKSVNAESPAPVTSPVVTKQPETKKEEPKEPIKEETKVLDYTDPKEIKEIEAVPSEEIKEDEENKNE